MLPVSSSEPASTTSTRPRANTEPAKSVGSVPHVSGFNPDETAMATRPPNAMYAPARKPPTSALSQLRPPFLAPDSTAATAIFSGVFIPMLTLPLGGPLLVDTRVITAATAGAGSGGLPAPPLDEELVGLELGEVGAQRAGQAAGLCRLRVPEQGDLPRGDLDHLDEVGLPGPAQERGPAPGPAHEQLVLPVRLHAVAPAAFSSARSPWKTSPRGVTIAGTSSTPAAAVASSRRRFVEPSSAPLISATGCISQAAAAISTLSRTPRSRPAANAWRNAASENATPRPICLA